MLTVTLSHLVSQHVAIFTYFTVKFPYIFINKHLYVFRAEQDNLLYSSELSISQLSSPCNTQRRKHHSVNCFSCFFTKTGKNRKNILITRTSYSHKQKFFILLKKKINFSPDGFHFSKQALTFQVFQARFWTTGRKAAWCLENIVMTYIWITKTKLYRCTQSTHTSRYVV